MMSTRISLLLASCLVIQACAIEEVVTAEETELIVADATPDETMLLDIGVVEFKSGLAADNDPEETGVYEEIRTAEVRYMPYHLKTTLQGSGHWGAVRVIPTPSAFTDILISGSIKQSNGEFITLDISVGDSRGRHWYDKSYSTQTGISSYSVNRDRREDPYQKVFNDISNDLKRYVEQLSAKDVQDIRQVTELKFFADMSPASYGEHLTTTEEGTVGIVRLPAENDPAVDRLRQIRERDRLVVDTLNAIPYHSWRKTSREESINYRQVKRSATMQKILGVVVIAGALAVDTDSSSYRQSRMNRGLQNIAIGQGFETLMEGITRGNEAGMHMESIKELSESFGAEAAPMVVTVEGETRRLTGTAAAQYESWRRLLKQIYEAETGFVETAEDTDPGPVRVPEPAG
jgi:hypothetical protein